MRSRGQLRERPSVLAIGLLCTVILQLRAYQGIAGASPGPSSEGFAEASDPGCYNNSSLRQHDRDVNATMASQLAALKAAQKRADDIMRRAGEVLSRVALLPGEPPVNCTCQQFNDMVCFGPGCHPCDKSCFTGNWSYLASMPGPFESGPWCSRGCLPCCNTLADVPDTNCTLPEGGCATR